MRATPDVPDHMTSEWFLGQAHQARLKAAAIIPISALQCYSIDALLITAEICERLARGEWTFEGLSNEMLIRQKALTYLYGVDP